MYIVNLYRCTYITSLMYGLKCTDRCNYKKMTHQWISVLPLYVIEIFVLLLYSVQYTLYIYRTFLIRNQWNRTVHKNKPVYSGISFHLYCAIVHFVYSSTLFSTFQPTVHYTECTFKQKRTQGFQLKVEVRIANSIDNLFPV